MSDWFIERFQAYADRPAIISKDTSVSYLQLADKIALLAERFASNKINSGHTVFLKTDYSLDGIAALFALFKLRTIVVPLTGISDSETKDRSNEVPADFIVHIQDDAIEIEAAQTESTQHALIQRLISTRDAGLILFSSGSTGHPKAMIHNATYLLESGCLGRRSRSFYASLQVIQASPILGRKVQIRSQPLKGPKGAL
jgi:acyl-coenzyme A synthetase/AMP-(fatty) acid ligase